MMTIAHTSTSFALEKARVPDQKLARKFVSYAGVKEPNLSS